MLRFFPRKTISLLAICVSFGLMTSAGGAAEAPQKLRVAYAAVTAAFSIPWIAKEAGIFQRHGLDVELVYIAAGRGRCRPWSAAASMSRRSADRQESMPNLPVRIRFTSQFP